MLAFLFILLSWFTGYYILKKAFRWIFNVNNSRNLFGSKCTELKPWTITIPASFLLGNLFSTWITYIISYVFHFVFKVPMIFGNIIAFLYLILLSLYFIKKEHIISNISHKFKSLNKRFMLDVLLNNKFEFYYSGFLIIFYTFFFFAYLNISNGKFIFGDAVNSDLQFHLSIARSFSFGSNFPTQYPYFPNGHMNYHFLFQFLMGNLEFLGLRVDWAFNIMSVLSMVAFLTLLYSFAILLTGKRWVGVLTSIFFILRSSFAVFTFGKEFKSFAALIKGIINIDRFIGKTGCESWGLWTQNVYMGQRHFPFSLGIMIFILIAVYPRFSKMAVSLNRIKSLNDFKARARLWCQEFILKKDAWLPLNIKRSIIIGLILGLVGFWNGAVVMSLLPMLFVIAIMSKHRLDFAYIGLLAASLFFLQYFFFLGISNQGLSPKLNIGFLAENSSITSILKYYIELLGIMPFVLLIGVFIGPKGSKWLSLAFLVPLVMATTYQFTGSVPGFNHKLVNLSVCLLNIFPAYAVYKIFSKRNIFLKLISCIMILCLTVTGIIDLFTVYNKSNFVSYYSELQSDPLTEWIIQKTDRTAVFITHTYDNLHPVVKAGRRMFFGCLLFSEISGYNVREREIDYKKILSGSNEKETLELIKRNNISYLIVDSKLKSTPDFNENFFSSRFSVVYSDSENRVYQLFK